MKLCNLHNPEDLGEEGSEPSEEWLDRIVERIMFLKEPRERLECWELEKYGVDERTAEIRVYGGQLFTDDDYPIDEEWNP